MGMAGMASLGGRGSMQTRLLQEDSFELSDFSRVFVVFLRYNRPLSTEFPAQHRMSSVHLEGADQSQFLSSDRRWHSIYAEKARCKTFREGLTPPWQPEQKRTPRLSRLCNWDCPEGCSRKEGEDFAFAAEDSMLCCPNNPLPSNDTRADAVDFCLSSCLPQ